MSTTRCSSIPASPGLLREACEAGGGGGCGSLGSLPKIGLALSGGGARGLAHVGVLQVLEEARIPIAAVAGTSMGAYVGSLFASGLAGAKLEELAREIKDRRTLLGLVDPIFPPSAGLMRGEKIRQHLERSLGPVTFAELAIPLLVVATDLDTLAPHVFSSGPVAPAVHASAAIPGICTPVEINGYRFTDGGAAEPLPVSLLRESFPLDAVIAVNVLPTTHDLSNASAPTSARSKSGGLIRQLLRPVNLLAHGNVLDTFRRALMTSMLRLVDKECRRADIVIHPQLSGSTWFDFENHARYIAAGRAAAEAALPAIHDLLRHPKGEPNHANLSSPALLVNHAA